MKIIVSFIVAILLFQCSTPVFKPLAYYADNSLNQILIGPDISYNADSDFINIAGTPFHFVRVDGGTFQMGSDSTDANEKPVHQVSLSTYYISETEVTQKLWRAVMYFEMPSNNTDLPIYNITWNECQKFIKMLNKKTGYKFSLPTEAQWEFAARGGNLSQGYIYSGSDNLWSVAWSGLDRLNEPKPVGTTQPNELGIYDMSGNVEEWCQDWYGHYTSDAQTDPTGPSSGRVRVVRGGSYNNSENSCRITHRSYFNPTSTSYFCGLRLVLTR